MLRREVWGYWYLTSQGGKIVDPDLVELRKPWADPNKQENIMYSGHLLLMVSLHAMLFNDDKYDEPEALTFVWDPIFWGFGPEKFTYSRSSLQQAILAEMERENWKGVCCEPNCIFIVCNQFPIIAMRYNDFRKGTNVAEEVLQKYLAAWGGENSLVQEDKFFFNWYMVKQGRTVPGGLAVSAWTSAFMNGWNSQFVHSLFPAQSLGFLSYAPDGRINLNDEKVAKSIRELAESETIDPYAWSTKHRAHDRLGQTGEAQPAEPLSQPMFGYVAQWVSEVGDAATCDGLLLHADRFLNPCWERGGLFYPRSSELTDKDGNWKYMDPYSGNAGIAYARLNVTDGQKRMWDAPWSSEHFSGYPFLDGLSLSSDVDFLRGAWDQLTEAMVVTMRTWDASQKTIRVLVRNLPVGHYGVYKNEILSGTLEVADSSDPVHVAVEVGAEETDLVLLKCK
ncbi:hypothetical protein MPH_02247 [Macrophomina phaseolina MS6]|uniref:Linalool dehydratase/isomerase domain-containing protein n=1 Tax=Macrophomina phaseolina (strain MS6) TaxID=1126212 RepID=K2S602_MACPH|nr:hypothetical protein MPH_02247 [Macrophomina phaseolina MS6]